MIGFVIICTLLLTIPAVHIPCRFLSRQYDLLVFLRFSVKCEFMADGLHKLRTELVRHLIGDVLCRQITALLQLDLDQFPVFQTVVDLPSRVKNFFVCL